MTRDDRVLAFATPEETIAAASVAGVLSPAMQDLGRRYVAARRRSGEAMLEAAELLAEARAAAQHGEWATWLTATDTSPDTAERLLAIAARARTDRQFADKVQQDFFGGVSVAALVAQAPEPVRSDVLSRDVAPPRREVERQIRESKIRTGAESQPATAAQPQLPAPPPSELDLLRAEAADYGLVVDVSVAGVVVHWPDEDPGAFSRVSIAEAREWIAEDASAAYAERLRNAAATAGSPATAFARALLDSHDGMAAHYAGLMLNQNFAQLHAAIGGSSTAAEHSAFCAAMVAAARAWARTYREEGS